MEFELGRGLEVGADAIAQRGRLADVDHAALVVLHQVDAGRFGQGFGFFEELGDGCRH